MQLCIFDTRSIVLHLIASENISGIKLARTQVKLSEAWKSLNSAFVAFKGENKESQTCFDFLSFFPYTYILCAKREQHIYGSVYTL